MLPKAKMIPKVRRWKVRVSKTGDVYFIETINRRFARWLACSELGLWGQDLKISLAK
jgi:hypothetical protein